MLVPGMRATLLALVVAFALAVACRACRAAASAAAAGALRAAARDCRRLSEQS